VITGLLLYDRREVFHATEKSLFLLAYALAAMVIPGGLLNRLPPHPVWGAKHSWAYLWLSFPCYGYALLGLCLLVCYARLERLRQQPS
jgi:hypothetical protein